MGSYDGGKLKAAEDAILDRMAAVLRDATPAASAVKELAEAFSMLENATRNRRPPQGASMP